MSNDWFRFKRFTVTQSGAAMKVGTDGTLLGAWAAVDNPRRILDIGTGTGLIALMMAQRTEDTGVMIDAVEIDGPACRQAADNFAASPWASRLKAVHSGLREFALGLNAITAAQIDPKPPQVLYSHIVSNPPFFQDSLPSPDRGRRAARHASSLPHDELIRICLSLLLPEGVFSVILPAETGETFIRAAGIRGLTLSRITAVRPLPGVPPKRTLLEFRNNGKPVPERDIERGELIVETAPGGNYSQEYRALTRDFYLKF